MKSNDLVRKSISKNKATSNTKIQQVLSSLPLNDVGIYWRDGAFSTNTGLVNLRWSEGTHWVCYISENYFDSYGWDHPQKLSKIFIKQKGFCLYSEYKIHGLTCKRDSFCASFCLYILYLTKFVRIDFRFAVLKLYYEMLHHCWRFFKIHDAEKNKYW